jgi:IS5 family transposase
MLNALILMPLSNESESGLARLLKRLPSLAEECGFRDGRTPSQPTINRFKHRIGLQGFRRIFKQLIEKLVGGSVVEGPSLVVDATGMGAQRSDLDAAWGHVSKEGLIYGYKVHIIVDYKSELPVELSVTPANVHENAMFKPLVKTAKKNGVKASWVAGDAIHDSRETRGFLKSIGARAFIDRNPRRAGKGKAKPMSKTYKRMKASVERVFSRAKGLLGLDRIRVRGFASVSIHVYIVFIAMLSVAVAANGNGLEERMRCIRSIF